MSLKDKFFPRTRPQATWQQTIEELEVILGEEPSMPPPPPYKPGVGPWKKPSGSPWKLPKKPPPPPPPPPIKKPTTHVACTIIFRPEITVEEAQRLIELMCKKILDPDCKDRMKVFGVHVDK